MTSVRGAERIRKNWANALAFVDDFRPILRNILGAPNEAPNNENQHKIRPSIILNFARRMTPNGSKWADLKESTLERKQKKYPGKSSLIATGEMYRSVVDNTENTVFVLDKRKMIFGTSLKYAGFHLAGTNKMPPRIFMGFSNKQRSAIKVLLKEWAMQTMRGKAVK